MIASIAKNPKELSILARNEGKVPISYSQFSLFASCPYAWKLKYIDKIKDDSYSIHLLFGSAMHTVIQEYITTFYKKGGPAADEISFDTRLLEEMKKHYVEAIESLPISLHDFTNQNEMLEFYKQGLEILYFLRKNRSDYFSKKDWELVGIEVPLLSDTDSNSKVAMIGFLDIVLKNTKERKYKIIDLKTSTMGWNNKARLDVLKNAQLILYKKYYAKQYGLDPKMIDVEFIILRRVIYEGSEFPMKRIQRHCPASGKPTMNKIEGMLKTFVNVFDANGEVMENFEFTKNAGSACKYCFYGDMGMCDKNKKK